MITPGLSCRPSMRLSMPLPADCLPVPLPSCLLLYYTDACLYYAGDKLLLCLIKAALTHTYTHTLSGSSLIRPVVPAL